jgi:hypothetical protein
MDFSILPVIWPVSAVSYDNTYVINNTNPSQNGSVRITGFLPNEPSANVSLITYHGYDEPLSNTTSVLVISYLL